MRSFDNSQLLEPDKRYDFFISYSHKDKEVALDLYYLAIANGLVPWLDDRNLDYGEYACPATFIKGLCHRFDVRIMRTDIYEESIIESLKAAPKHHVFIVLCV